MGLGGRGGVKGGGTGRSRWRGDRNLDFDKRKKYLCWASVNEEVCFLGRPMWKICTQKQNRDSLVSSPAAKLLPFFFFYNFAGSQ